MNKILTTRYYSAELIKIKRGQSVHGYSNAKPEFVFALIDCIRSQNIQVNQFHYDDILLTKYKEVHKKYCAHSLLTPMFKPFYYLVSDGFWMMNWKDNGNSTIVSAKNLRENVWYASLDGALWNILQDEENRIALQNTIIENFFKPKKQ